MARPEPEIVLRHENDAGVIYEVTRARATYVITYMDEPIGIRSESVVLGEVRRKYKKTAYPNEGSAIRQVRHLNKIFNCEDFGYKII